MTDRARPAVRLDAQTLYGSPPIQGQGPGGGKQITGGGEGVSTPDATVTRLPLGSVLDDPAFWLVAMIGVAAYLAIAST